MEAIILKKGKEKSLKRYHPWVFSGAIYSKAPFEDGTNVKVLDAYKVLLGIGYYTNGSIAVRMLTFKDEAINQMFWNTKIEVALNKRIQWNILNDHTNVYRLIHGEGDGIPGLVIDVYNHSIVVQYHNPGIYNFRKEIMNALGANFPKNQFSIYEKGVGHWALESGLNLKPSEPIIEEGMENGILFKVNISHGQKTGFFIDQRPNRKLVEQFSFNKKVCNLFCYTGGFSMYAKRGGASSIDSVDISQTALDIAHENAQLNKQKDGHHFLSADIMKVLDDPTFPIYDLMIVDPPAFAKSVRKKHAAVKAYQRLNVLALRKVAPGGIMFTFSCSQVVDPLLFENTIRSAGIISGRKISVLKKLSQGMDHPVNIFHPEGRYLKGLMLAVE